MKPIISIDIYFGINDDDTALCNRILWWELAQEINKKHNFEFDIFVTHKNYFDIFENLNLPNTIIEKVKYLLYNPNPNTKNFIPITFDLFLDIFNNRKKLDTTLNYRLDFDFTIIDEDDFDPNEKRVIQEITLKNKNTSNFIDLNSNKFFCFHLRRNNGVTVTEKDISTLPYEIQNEYKYLTEKNINMDEGYFFYRDYLYFDIIESVLKLNPEQKFYVSHDLPEHFLDYWKQKYEGHIFTKKDFMKDLNLVSDTDFDVFDLFFISNSDFLVGSPMSSWSLFAKKYKYKSFMNIDEDPENILQNYKKTLDFN